MRHNLYHICGCLVCCMMAHEPTTILIQIITHDSCTSHVSQAMHHNVYSYLLLVGMLRARSMCHNSYSFTCHNLHRPFSVSRARLSVHCGHVCVRVAWTCSRCVHVRGHCLHVWLGTQVRRVLRTNGPGKVVLVSLVLCRSVFLLLRVLIPSTAPQAPGPFGPLGESFWLQVLPCRFPTLTHQLFQRVF